MCTKVANPAILPARMRRTKAKHYPRSNARPGAPRPQDNTQVASDCLDVLSEAVAAFGPHVSALHDQLLEARPEEGGGELWVGFV